jgi:hypothetical protein
MTGLDPWPVLMRDVWVGFINGRMCDSEPVYSVYALQSSRGSTIT